METIQRMASASRFSYETMGQVVSFGGWLPLISAFILLLLLVGVMYRAYKRSLKRPAVRRPSLTEQSEQLKRNLAEIQARNEAEIAQTRAILEEARNSGALVVKETREGVIQVTREETERGKAEIRKVREEHLAELRREGAKLGEEEPPQAGPDSQK
ncbi:MAG: hypothetical protein JWP00_3054 [Chloroflexi bacterium]|nr:hypothetical protein [Chloroflexota bacterium]